MHSLLNANKHRGPIKIMDGTLVFFVNFIRSSQELWFHWVENELDFYLLQFHLDKTLARVFIKLLLLTD